ncbi:fimbria/pilus periplasmic chaperone [Vibrio mediterranei]|uniref:fimbria/pilus periplasmic chaperone n=1 Tax=Vibrio mediterranei TaxID=689 RepID=UPI0015532866|nr:fimbria/pilus periplasmic chaperone [Vibrio mediterranei]
MKIKLILTFALNSILFTNEAIASLALDATRYIYKGDGQFISATVDNRSKEDYGAQIWVENIVENDTRPSFIATPSFFKINKGRTQVFRIMKVSDHMPNDKESIYWLNLQEIPPAGKGSGLAIAIRTRVKLIYRPEAIAEGRLGAEKNLTVEHLPGEQWLVNTTPYIFTIASVQNAKGEAIELSKEANSGLKMFKPGDRINVTGNQIHSVSALNDFGSVNTYILDGPGDD